MKVDPHSRWMHRPWRLVLAGAVAVTLLAVGERSINGFRAGGEPAWGACWIWAEVPFDDPRPIAFLAVREFELAAVPREAWLSAVADESLVLFLNGAYVGAGTYTTEASLSRYRVEKLLRPGTNRLVAELRSHRGVGGFLANLLIGGEGDSGRPVVVTDENWRIFRRDERRAWRAGAPLSGGEPARVWPLPPTGRWRLEKSAEELPIPYRGGARPRRAEASAVWALARPDRVFDLKVRRRTPRLREEFVYDWGKIVRGFLSLHLPSLESPPALAWFGEEVPDPTSRPADEFLIFIPGQKLWRDLHPRRFRYLVLVGLRPGGKPLVRRLEPGAAFRLRAPPPPKGVFGIDPPVAPSAAEVAIWQRLRRAG